MTGSMIHGDLDLRAVAETRSVPLPVNDSGPRPEKNSATFLRLRLTNSNETSGRPAGRQGKFSEKEIEDARAPIFGCCFCKQSRGDGRLQAERKIKAIRPQAW